MSSSFLSRDGYRRFYRNASASGNFLAADNLDTTGVAFIPVRNASYQIYIQKIIVNVTTVAAEKWTFQDEAGTPVVIGVLAASAPLGENIVVDGGALGIPLTLGTSLDIVAAGAGVAGTVIIEAYQRLGTVIAADSGAAKQ